MMTTLFAPVRRGRAGPDLGAHSGGARQGQVLRQEASDGPKGSLGVSRLDGKEDEIRHFLQARRVQERHCQDHRRFQADPVSLHRFQGSAAQPLERAKLQESGWYLLSHIFSSVAQFERRLVQERTTVSGSGKSPRIGILRCPLK